MGLFGFAGAVGKAAINVVTLPVTAAKSVVNGDIIFEDEHSLSRNLDRLKNNISEAEDELE